jgi:hypothetical protein
MIDSMPLLSIGIDRRGISPASEEVFHALNAIQRHVMDRREAFSDDGMKLLIIFEIPGPIGRPRKAGVHLSRFEPARSRALVVAVIPDDLGAEGVQAYALNVLEASERLLRDKVAVSSTAIRMGSLLKCMEDVRQALRSPRLA